jgi:hypothetical protein
MTNITFDPRAAALHYNPRAGLPRMQISPIPYWAYLTVAVIVGAVTASAIWSVL